MAKYVAAVGVIRRGPQTSTVAVTDGEWVTVTHRDGPVSKTVRLHMREKETQ